MLKLAIFDLDGTLGDTLPLCIESFRRAAHAVSGQTYRDEEIFRLFGPDETGVLAQLLPHASQEEVAHAVSEYERVYALLHDEYAPKPFDGVIEMLDDLKQNDVILAIVTGKALSSAKITMKQFGFFDDFRYIGCGSAQGVVKDECIKSILQESSILASDSIYIGDAPADVIACQKVPIRIIGAAWAQMADPEALHELHADYVLENFCDLQPLLQSL